MGSVHVVWEDTGRRSDNDRTDNLDFGIAGSWW